VMYHNDYYANFGDMSVEEYVDFFLSTGQLERFDQIVDMIPQDVESVLDVGAGFGHLLETAWRKRGIKGVGIEITDSKIEYARRHGIDMRKGEASALPFPDKNFDLVVSCEVIEHLPYGSYEKALSEFERVSKRYILIEVPFDEKRRFVKCPYCGATSHPCHHMRSFRDDNMVKLFPNSRLIGTKKIGERSELYFEGFLSKFPIRSWPPFMVCPSCGYRLHQVPRDAIYQNRTSQRVRNYLKKILRSILGRKVPLSILGLYSVD
jgi:ubiquinone/menaquinone biosynthesis C-methylase UbiE